MKAQAIIASAARSQKRTAWKNVRNVRAMDGSMKSRENAEREAADEYH